MASPRQHIIHYEDPPPAQELTTSQVNNCMFFYVKLPRRRYSTYCLYRGPRAHRTSLPGWKRLRCSGPPALRPKDDGVVYRGEMAEHWRDCYPAKRRKQPKKNRQRNVGLLLENRTTSSTKSSGLPGRTNPACRQRPSAGLYMVRSSPSKSG